MLADPDHARDDARDHDDPETRPTLAERIEALPGKMRPLAHALLAALEGFAERIGDSPVLHRLVEAQDAGTRLQACMFLLSTPELSPDNAAVAPVRADVLDVLLDELGLLGKHQFGDDAEPDTDD